jgi:hypothetical protein
MIMAVKILGGLGSVIMMVVIAMVVVAMIMPRMVMVRVIVTSMIVGRVGDLRSERGNTVAKTNDLLGNRRQIAVFAVADRHGAGGHRNRNVFDARHTADSRVDLRRAARAIHAFDTVAGLCGFTHGAILLVIVDVSQMLTGRNFQFDLQRHVANPEMLPKLFFGVR